MLSRHWAGFLASFLLFPACSVLAQDSILFRCQLFAPFGIGLGDSRRFEIAHQRPLSVVTDIVFRLS